MKIGALPFWLVLISALMPMICSLAGAYSYHLPAYLVLGVGSLITISARNDFRIAFCRQLNWAIVLMALLLMLQVLTGRGFVILGAGGYVLIFALFFYNLFLTGNVSLATVTRGISLLYKFFIIGLIIETLLIICGQQPLLSAIFNSSNAPGYKDYNQADVLRMLGLFQDMGGPNSVLLGSQIAGMLSLFAVIWFFFVMKSESEQKITSHPSLWLVLSLAMLLVTVNGTVFVMVALAITIDRLFIRKQQRVALLVSMSLLFLGLYALVSQGYLFKRIFSDELALTAYQLQMFIPYGLDQKLKEATVFDYYVFSFLSPVYLWLSAGWIDKFLGVGASFFLNDQVYIGGDFGFAADVLLKSGLVWAITFLTTILVICSSSLKLITTGTKDLQSWSGLGSVNALISLLWLFSTVHYNQAMQNPGGVMLFAMHLALVMYCHRRSHAFFVPQRSVCAQRKGH